MPGKASSSRARSAGTPAATPHPLFFASPAEFRAWLEQNHDKVPVLTLGLYKRDSGRPSIPWPEAVDQALCFGWIDGVRRTLDAASYSIRFTPRKPSSTWSAVNIGRVQELTSKGLMRPPGLAAFESRLAKKSAIYSYEQRAAAKLDAAAELEFRANKKAWAFFEQQPPWYRRTATYWVVSAKREETRARRLATLIRDSAAGRAIGPLTRPGKV
jgi:uncharacterized protein YdeI (YjbR/CyaY-like superfamily)